MEMKGKEIRRRLNVLENDLKNLRRKVVLPCAHPLSSAQTKNDTKIITYFRSPLGNNYNVQANHLRKETATTIKRDDEGSEFIPKRINLYDNQIITCLQCINNNIEKGSEAMRKIASMTEISNMSITTCNSLLHIRSQDKNSMKYKTSSVRALRTSSDSSIKTEMQALVPIKRLKKNSSEEEVLAKTNLNTKQVLHKERQMGKNLEKKINKLKTKLIAKTTPIEKQIGETIDGCCKQLSCHHEAIANNAVTRLNKKENNDLAKRLDELQNDAEVENWELEKLKKDLNCLKECGSKNQKQLGVAEGLSEMLNIKERKLNDKKNEDLLKYPIAINEEKKLRIQSPELKEKISRRKVKLKVRREEHENRLSEATKQYNDRFYDLLIKYESAQTELEKQGHTVQTLTEKIQCLTEKVQEEKKRAAEYCEIKNHQEDMIKNLSAAISNRDLHLKKLMREGTLVVKTCEDMKKKILILEQGLEQKSMEVEKLRKEADIEKDNISAKDKMISDQMDTIKCLRNTVDENRKIIEAGRSEIKKIMQDYNKLEYCKDELKGQISQMECTQEEAQKSIEREEKHKSLLQQIECQVLRKQKEWETQLRIMTDEKNKAIKTVRFTTQKLIDAMSEFEKQMEAEKNKQLLLEKLLTEKTLDLEKAKEEIMELKQKLWQCQDNTTYRIKTLM